MERGTLFVCDYLFSLDRLPQKLYDIFSLTVCCLEAFRPGYQNTLWRTQYYIETFSKTTEKAKQFESCAMFGYTKI